MESSYALALFFSLLLLLTATTTSTSSSSANSLDSTIRDYAFKVLSQRRTGIVHRVPLPRNLSGIEASVVRLRSGSFWIKGANSTAFRIPPKSTIPTPYVRRIVIIYQNLGNWSSSSYAVPGYSLIAPVVGFLAYDVSNTSLSNNTTELDVKVMSGSPISITFSEAKIPKGMYSSNIKCVKFGRSDRSVELSDTAAVSGTCSTTRTGHFAIVVPAAAAEGRGRGRGSRWGIWVGACGGGGVVGLVLLGLVGVGILRLVKNRKLEGMEGRGEEGEVLGSVWIGGSRMPWAAMIRTQPVMETEIVP